jgi:hypothetical protein
MTQPEASVSLRPALPRWRVWHLCLLTVFVAVAIANIQDQRRAEPALIALAVGGFLLYAFLGWSTWRLVRRFRSRIGMTPLLILYLGAMAGLFLVSTIVYLMMEHAYLVGF